MTSIDIEPLLVSTLALLPLSLCQLIAQYASEFAGRVVMSVEGYKLDVADGRMLTLVSGKFTLRDLKSSKVVWSADLSHLCCDTFALLSQSKIIMTSYRSGNVSCYNIKTGRVDCIWYASDDDDKFYFISSTRLILRKITDVSVCLFSKNHVFIWNSLEHRITFETDEENSVIVSFSSGSLIKTHKNQVTGIRRLSNPSHLIHVFVKSSTGYTKTTENFICVFSSSFVSTILFSDFANTQKQWNEFEVPSTHLIDVFETSQGLFCISADSGIYKVASFPFVAPIVKKDRIVTLQPATKHWYMTCQFIGELPTGQLIFECHNKVRTNIITDRDFVITNTVFVEPSLSIAQILISDSRVIVHRGHDIVVYH